MIGIVTPYDANNYGSKLQAYAVQEYLSQYDRTEIIRYQPGIIERIIKKAFFILYLHKFSDKKGIGKYLDDEKELIQRRRDAITNFNVEYSFTPILRGRKALRNYTNKYSGIVCGSDQIWNPSLLANRTWMLEFASEETKKVSFSASFGVNSIPRALMGVYKKRLSRFFKISVREESGLKLLKEMGFGEAKLFFDPTLALDKEKWGRLCEKSKLSFDEPYIFCYFLGSETLGRDIAEELRSQTGYKIINIAHFKAHIKRDEHFGDFDLYDVNPYDFINLIRNAAYICTDSFHGTAFAIMFQKKVFTVYRHSNNDQGNTNTRIDSLVHLLDISEVLIHNMEEFVQKKDQCIDYTKANMLIAENRKKVDSFFSEVFQ